MLILNVQGKLTNKTPEGKPTERAILDKRSQTRPIETKNAAKRATIISSVHLYQLVARHEQLHDAPPHQIGHRTDAEDDEVAGLLALEAEEGHLRAVGIVEQIARADVDEKRADATRHASDADDRGHRALGEHVAAHRIDVGRPRLVRRPRYADDDDGEPVGILPQGLGEQGEQREEGEDEHRLHARGVGILARAVDDDGGQLSAVDGQHGDGVEHEDEPLRRGRVGSEPVDIGDVGRHPEQEEPPHAVGHEPCARSSSRSASWRM